ncbi:MAG TPA: PIG-L deacetylase family protein [Candidatus Limnocylindrales bacterium]|nr:PIG-L deacetylase family protein [Candidatus Limnocylindrales bacterium]
MTIERETATPGVEADAAAAESGAGRAEPSAAPGPRAQAPDSDRPERILVIVAHPDDADFGPAATVAAWVDGGSVARLVCCTSGDAGGEDPELDPLELAHLREQEQRAAAAIVGYEEVVFLHRPDGALENDLALREQLVRLLREFRPDAVMAMDPTVLIHDDGYIQHTDHRAAGMAALDAVYPAARNPMAFPHLARQGLAAHVVPRVYLFWSERPNIWLDIGATLERKVAALRAHASQIREPEKLETRIREWAAEEGARCGVAAAEAFRLVRIE